MRTPPAIREGHFAGDYLLDDIKAALTPEEWDDFCRWHNGQTGGIDEEGRLVVYRFDFERWQKHLPPYD